MNERPSYTETLPSLAKKPHFIGVGPKGWAKSTCPSQAARLCYLNHPRNSRRGLREKIRVFEVHPDTTVTGLGDWEYPAGAAFPREVIPTPR